MLSISAERSNSLRPPQRRASPAATIRISEQISNHTKTSFWCDSEPRFDGVQIGSELAQVRAFNRSQLLFQSGEPGFQFFDRPTNLSIAVGSSRRLMSFFTWPMPSEIAFSSSTLIFVAMLDFYSLVYIRFVTCNTHK